MSKPTNTLPTRQGHLLPSSLTQILTVTKYELVNYFRSRRFLVLMIIGLFISGILTTLVAYYKVSSFASDALGFYSFWWGNSIPFVIVLAGIFFGGDSISGEFQNKTGYFLVANPLRRSTIYIGKWLGVLIASLIIFGVYVAIAVGNQIYYFGSTIPYQFGESLLFSLLYLVAVLGFTFFFSSLFKTSAMSILMTAILFLFAFRLIQMIVAGLAQIEPWFIITYGSDIISNVLQNPYPTTTTMINERGRSITSFQTTVPEGIAIMLGYFIITSILGLVLFERKEFT